MIKFNKVSSLKSLGSLVACSLFMGTLVAFVFMKTERGLLLSFLPFLAIALMSIVYGFIRTLHIADVVIVNSNSFEIKTALKNSVFTFDEVVFQYFGSVHWGTFDVMFNHTNYQLCVTEENFNSVCIIIGKCKKSEVRIEDFIAMMEKAKWMW